MQDDQKQLTYLDPVPAIPVIQGCSTFYLFAISGKKLLEIAYTSERTQYNKTGIQRGLRTDRLWEIGEFLQSNGSKRPLLPNAIVVSLSSKSYFSEGHIHVCHCPSSEAFVIDGQHRLWAFDPKYSDATDFNVVVAAFINLDDSDKAFIFRSINSNQRKINPSLVYDLIPMLREQESVRFEDSRCQELVVFLNEVPDSPWKDRIGMVGAGNRIISQSSFISALKKLFKKGHLFASADPDFFEERMQGEVLLQYFKAIQSAYSVEWDNKAFFLCKYIGVSAVVNLLERIVADLRAKNITISNENGLMIKQDDFTSYISRLRTFSFSTAEAKKQGISYVGESGVSELTKKASACVFGEPNADNH